MFVTSSFARNLTSAVGAALIATACLTVAVAPAAAAPAATSKTVSYGDLNLANAQGRAALDARIKSAARSVCSTGSNGLQARTSETLCIKAAIRGATVS